MKLKLEKILKRDDGSRVKLTISMSVMYPVSNEVNYIFRVELCKKGKRTWSEPTDNNNYKHRLLSLEERINAINMAYLDHVSLAEINNAKLELWQSIKPI